MEWLSQNIGEILALIGISIGCVVILTGTICLFIFIVDKGKRKE